MAYDDAAILAKKDRPCAVVYSKLISAKKKRRKVGKKGRQQTARNHSNSNRIALSGRRKLQVACDFGLLSSAGYCDNNVVYMAPFTL